MLGLIDRLYASRKLQSDYVEPETDRKPEVIKNGEKKVSWFCFVPRGVSKTPFLRNGIIPKDGDVFVYTISSLNLIKPNPEETVERLQEIYDDAIERMNSSSAEGHALNILGVSLGNVLSIRAAGSINSGIERLVSIVGGSNLGLSAWDSLLTRYIAKQSGCSSPEEYEKRLAVFSPVNYTGGLIANQISIRLGVFSPVNYTGGLTANQISIRLGTMDLFIPYKYGQQLANALIERGKKINSKIDYKSYIGADHCAAIFFSALDKIYN